MYDVIIGSGIRILIAILPFLKEKISPIPNLTGLWTFVVTYDKTAYNPFKQLKVFYVVLLTQEGTRIYGTGEKIGEITANGEKKEYVGKNKVHIKIPTGSIIKNYTKESELNIHIEEAGELRDSSSIHTLIIKDNKRLEGTFISTIANTTGTVIWERGNKDYEFSNDHPYAKYNETKTS